jgi:hypothetical protein
LGVGSDHGQELEICRESVKLALYIDLYGTIDERDFIEAVFPRFLVETPRLF